MERTRDLAIAHATGLPGWPKFRPGMLRLAAAGAPPQLSGAGAALTPQRPGIVHIQISQSATTRCDRPLTWACAEWPSSVGSSRICARSPTRGGNRSVSSWVRVEMRVQ